MISKNKGIIYCLTAALCTGLGNVFGRLLAIDLDPLLLMSLATLISAVFCWLFVVFYSKIKIFVPFKFIGWYITLGILHSVAGFLTIWGLKYTSAMDVNFLLRIEVIFAIIFGFLLFQERIKTAQAFGIFLAFGGTYIFVTGFEKHIRVADTLVLVAAIFWASSWALSKKLLGQGLNPFILTATRLTISSLIFAAILVLFQKTYVFPLAHLSNLLLMCLLAIFLNFVLFTFGLKYMRLWQATFTLQFSIIIFGAFFAWSMLGETLTPIEWLGGAIIAGGLGLVTLARDNRNLLKNNT